MTASLASVGVVHALEDAQLYRAERGTEVVSDMVAARRLSAALYLLATADMQALRFERYAAFDQRPVPRITDPRAWMLTTALFRALVAGLPRKRTPMVILDEQARHASGCPGGINGTCRCQPRPATDRIVLAVVMAAAGREATA